MYDTIDRIQIRLDFDINAIYAYKGGCVHAICSLTAVSSAEVLPQTDRRVGNMNEPISQSFAPIYHFALLSSRLLSLVSIFMAEISASQC